MFDSAKQTKRSFTLLTVIVLACLFPGVRPTQAQSEKLLPPPEGSVNDFASVIDSGTSRRLENLLANLKERAGINLTIVTVKTTNGKKIYDYSLQAAREWNVGALQSRESSLLLVVSTDDAQFVTQVSRRARGDLPDGLIGEMGERMRDAFGKGSYGEGLLAGVETFINRMAERRGFSLEGMDQAREPQAAPPQTPQPTPTPAEEKAQQVTTVATDSLPKEPPAEASTEVAAKEPATAEAATAKQTSLRDAFTKTPANRDRSTKTVAVPRDSSDKAELDALIDLPLGERIERLKAFVESHPRSQLKTFAVELIVSARAALGDEKLKAGDPVGGVEQFGLAIEELPDKISDALFTRVVSQIPANLFIRGQRLAASDASRLISQKVKDDPKRLLALAGFFLSVEDADEAARLAEMAIQVAPDMAAAHQALGAARHIGLRLDEAATEYARALELDPKLNVARRSLADLRRGAGRTEEALALYREQLTIDPADKAARAGVVLSLFDLGKKEEAEAELAAALKDGPPNLTLLIGASYWHAAKGDAARAQELAVKSIESEPRHIWAHIALARAQVAQKRPLEAERVLRFARQYGRFPTLDYELASALAASGLYEEAANELARSFTMKDGQIETRLAGRVAAHGADFIELLAPERRAGIFQVAAADTQANARVLKGLLALHSALGVEEGRVPNTALVSVALTDFLSGEDEMLAYRQLYAASRLLARNVELKTVLELADNAKVGVEAALDAPAATVAVMADDLRDARAQAINSGGILTIRDVQRKVLSSILRGRIEDLTGWALFNQDKATEAIKHLRLALSVLPEGTVWWRATLWHLGASLEATGSQEEALAAYLKAYNPFAPSPVQRAIIEALYRKVNGSLDGLDAKIGPK